MTQISRRRLLLTFSAALPTLAACTAPSNGPSTAPRPVATTPTASPTASVSAAAGDLSLGVLTYNIMTSAKTVIPNLPSSAEPDLVWENRMPAVVDRIQVRDPDVVCLQENEGMPASGVKQVTGLAEQLPGYATLPTSVAEDTLQILFRKEYLEFLEGGKFKINVKGLNGAPKDRWCVWGRFLHRASQRQVRVFTAHMTAKSSAARAALRAHEWEELQAGIAERGGTDGPLVLCGDFNAYNDETRDGFNSHLLGIAALGLADTAQSAARDTSLVPFASTFSGMGAEVDGAWQYRAVLADGRHIDYICANASAVANERQVVLGGGPGQGLRSIEVGGQPYMFQADGPMGSDHNPVYSHITFA